MSLFRRIALIVRGYVATAGETLDRAAEEESRRELDARKRALRELNRTGESPVDAASAAAPELTRAQAAHAAVAPDYAFLGLRPGADLSTVEATWRELARRADPKRFPQGSEEERRAAELLRRINQAYARIREHLNPTEGRFGKLEL